MIGKTINFIRQLQNSDEQTKKRWLIIFSVPAIAAVIGLWILYINATTPRATSLAQGSTQIQGEQENQMIADIRKNLSTGLDVVIKKIKTPNSIIIENKNRNFILENLEKIPSTMLP